MGRIVKVSVVMSLSGGVGTPPKPPSLWRRLLKALGLRR